MRFGTKAAISACFAAPAIAAIILTGAGTASAQTVSPSAHTISTAEHMPTGPLFCNPFQRERWNLNGSNTVDVRYLFSNYYYTVDFTQRGSCLTGWLNDPYYPITQPISGTVYGNTVTFSFTYPSFVEGTRTYTGTISRFGGFVRGSWYQTGTAFPNFGRFTLSSPAARACPPWSFMQLCPVF